MTKKTAATAAEVLLTTCSNAKKDEKLVFVTDPRSMEIALQMWEAAADFPNKVMVMMTERTMHGQNTPPTVAAAMKEADVIFGCTKFSLFHSQARRDAVANGARFVNMVDYRPEMLKEGALFCDFEAVGETCRKMAEKLTGKSTCRITTPLGTDFTCSIAGRNPFPQFGRSLQPGQSSSPPDIECATCAVEGTGQGVVYIDGSIPHPLLGLIQEPIRLEIKDSQIISITGGQQAEIFKKILEDFGDPNVYCIGEIGIGLNPMCTLSGSMLEDEGCGGTVHLACGDNVGFGGTNASAYHIDMVFRAPTVVVDGETLLADGEVCV